MVDADLVRRKSGRILHHVERLRRRADTPAQRLSTDEDLANAVLMDLQQAIQCCIDLAIHVCVDERLGAPATAAEAFSMLSKAGHLEPELATRLTGAAGLRNLIVHQYADIDAARVLAVVRGELGDLVRFAGLVTTFVDPDDA